jgi:hypothetical protein
MPRREVDSRSCRGLNDRGIIAKMRAHGGRDPARDRPGLSLVACYGPKPTDFASTLAALQHLVLDRLGDRASPRPVQEVHATMLGLWDPTLSPARSPLDRAQALDAVPGYLNWVSTFLLSRTINLRFGGYRAQESYGMLSRGQPLRIRSFGISERQVVLIGWPWENGKVSSALDTLRRASQRFGLHHKYHRQATDVDPDAYLVIADLAEDIPPSDAESLATEGRALLDTRISTIVLDPGILSVVRYTDNHLPLEHSPVVSLRKALADTYTWTL